MQSSTLAFPDTFSAISRKTLITVFEQGPRRLAAAIDGLPNAAFDARPIADKWSINEIVLHTVDSELIGAARVRLVLAQNEPTLPGYDQDAWASLLKYGPFQFTRLANTLALFRHLRETTMCLFRNASEADWGRVGSHREFGPVTLRNLLELYADHSERHIAQIVERRTLLGNPVDLRPLLSERLY